MKLKYIIGGLISVFTLSFASCELDKNPLDTYSDVTEGDKEKEKVVVLKDKAAVLTQMQLIYNKLRDRQEHWHLDLLLIAESHSDNAYAGQTNAEILPYENNGIEGSNSVVARDWGRYLADVAEANKIICYVDSVKDASLTVNERVQFTAEAKIFRAMVYFDMVRIFGNVPVITTIAGNITAETIEEVYPQYFPSQKTEKETYLQIEKDLLEALPSAPNNNPANKTLLTKSVARTLLAKVYAEKPLRDYAKVIKYADEVTADGFELVADFSDLFGVNDAKSDAKARNTKESILEAQYFVGSGNWATWMFGRNLVNWNEAFTWAKWITPSRDLIKAYTNAGDNIRYAESVVFYKCTWNYYYPAENYAFMYKCRSGYNSVIKFRYADVLLMKAEAMIMKDSPDLAGAAAIIDKVRQRVGLAKLAPNVRANKEAMVEALLNERRLELAFEGQRWFDLVRLDKVETVMNAVFAKDPGRKQQVYPFDKTSYRLPIPQSVIDQNPNLVQNPGY